MAPFRDLLPWLDKLTGIDRGRVQAAIDAVHSWNLKPLTARIGRPRNIDDLVRVVLLVEDVELLVARGVQESKLISKLRDIAQFEATWAELRCASTIARMSDQDVQIELESGKAGGAHADVRLILPEGPPHSSIEIKAIGLSNQEVDFCQRMSPALDFAIPPIGIVTGHAPLDGKPPRIDDQLRAVSRLEAARRAAEMPGYPTGMAASVIVAREAEGAYARRTASRLEDALRQLPPEDEGWLGVYWTNGAPIRDVMSALDWTSIPEHVQGVVFIGCVMAFPHRNIDCFQMVVPRDHTSASLDIDSSYDETIARLILERTEASSGVRATLIRAPIRGKRRQVVRRDGSERIPPFTLLLDRDPVGPLMSGRDL